jgi:hypothetical protein
MNLEVVGQALSTLGKGVAPALIAKAKELGVPLPAELTEPGAELPPGQIIASCGRSPGTSSPYWRETRQTRMSLLSACKGSLSETPSPTRTYSSAMLGRRAELHSACARSAPSGPVVRCQPRKMSLSHPCRRQIRLR